MISFYFTCLLVWLAFILTIIVIELSVGLILWMYVTIQYVIKTYIVRYERNLRGEAHPEKKLPDSFREEE